MKDQEKDNDLIARFFDFALSEEELIHFEEKIANNQDFRKKVETYKEANTIINKAYPSAKESARTQKWEKLLNAKETTEQSKKIPWKLIGGIAAGLALLFSIWQLSSVGQEPDMDQLLAESWDKKVGLNYRTTRGESADALKQQIHLAFEAYQNKNYLAAISILSTHKEATLYYDDALLLRGLSYYKKGNIEKALETLETLSQYPKSKKNNVARWYLGLIHLEQGNREVAEHFLEFPNDTNGEIKLK